MKLPTTFEALIDEANHSELYNKLIHQLNKDFLLANIDLDFHEEVLPSILKLSEDVAFLILKREWQKVWYKNQF